MRKGERRAYYRSKIGWLEICASFSGIQSINFVSKTKVKHWAQDPFLKAAIRQLDQYFNGKRKFFSLKLKPKGTLFQQKVWRELKKVSYGDVLTYQRLAHLLRRGRAVRAVAGAIAKNRIAILIPCHRVVGARSANGGYFWGLSRKRWLISYERFG